MAGPGCRGGVPGLTLESLMRKPGEGHGLYELRVEAQLARGAHRLSGGLGDKTGQNGIGNTPAAQKDLGRTVGRQGLSYGDRGKLGECRLHVRGSERAPGSAYPVFHPVQGKVLAPGAFGWRGGEVGVRVQ